MNPIDAVLQRGAMLIATEAMGAASLRSPVDDAGDVIMDGTI